MGRGGLSTRACPGVELIGGLPSFGRAGGGPGRRQPGDDDDDDDDDDGDDDDDEEDDADEEEEEGDDTEVDEELRERIQAVLEKEGVAGAAPRVP